MMKNFHKGLVYAAVAGVALMTGCSHGNDVENVPSASPSSVAPSSSPTETSTTTPTVSSTPSKKATPAATKAGNLDETIFPKTVGPWKSVKGDGDEGSYEANGAWVHELDIETAMMGLNAQRCDGITEDPLPVPQHVLASTYERPGGARSNGEALQFASPEGAQKFLNGYKIMVKTCENRKNSLFTMKVVQNGPEFIGRRVMSADNTKWSEIVKVKGNNVVMLIINDEDGTFKDVDLKKLGNNL